MMQTLATPYEEHQKRFLLQWTRSVSPPRLASVSKDGGKLMRISHNVLLTHEDKTYSGAFIASASIPWGTSKGDTDLGGYHLVWTRDMVQTATALLACGTDGYGDAGAGVSGVYAADGRQLCAELLDRRNAVLDGHSAG